MDLRESVSAATPSEVVEFDQLTPTTGGVVFTPNTPTTTNVLYVSTVNASTWIYNGSSYVTYTAATLPNTPFYLLGTTIDAGGNKTAAIQHLGPLRATTLTGNGINITGINAANLETGVVSVNRLGSSGTRDNTTYLRGDNTWATAGLTNFTEAQSTSSPNATVNVDSLTAVASTTNADISIVPKGAGAFLLAVPDSLSTGGNKRGVGAVDLQMSRSLNTQIAGGIYSFTAGARNTASDYATSIGYNNLTTSNSASIGHDNVHSGANYGYAYGRANTVGASATNSFVAGYNNSVSADRTVAIGGGVTASGLNAIAIGSGGSIASANTSVVLGYGSISNNTSSIAIGYGVTASGTYSTVGGGQNNTSSGSHSFSTGFGNTAAGTSSIAMGASNSVSNDNSIGIGQSNTASGYRSASIGTLNSMTGTYTFAFGVSNTSSRSNAVAIGSNNTAGGDGSIAIGNNVNTFLQHGRIAFSSGSISSAGDIQKSFYILKGRTTDATPKTLISDNGTITTASIMVLQNNNVIRFKGSIVGKQTATTNIGIWDIDGVIVRGANAAATTLTISNINLVTNASSWGTPTLTADTTLGGLTINAIGLAGTNIQWLANFETSEVIY